MAGEFDVHLLCPAGISACERTAYAFERLLKEIQKDLPSCRELSLAVTKLQEASYWVKRGIAVQPHNQLVKE